MNYRQKLRGDKKPPERSSKLMDGGEDVSVATFALSVCGFIAIMVLIGSNATGWPQENKKEKLRHDTPKEFYKTSSDRSIEKEKKGLDTFPSGSFRFPSIQERVDYYMGNWTNVTSMDTSYLRPDYCTRDYLALGKSPGPRILGLEQIAPCTYVEKQNMVVYCRGILPLVVDPTSYTLGKMKYELMAFIHPGDHCESKKQYLPVIMKARGKTLDVDTTILWPLMVKRHYQTLFDLKYKLQSIPWNDKIDTLVWRGGVTGTRLKEVEKINAVAQGSPAVDVVFHILPRKYRDDPARAKSLSHLVGERIEKENLVKYKYLLSLEGNDVASGLKWMLWSNSVVFMNHPRCVSWAMEDKLVPFVHYIPLEDDFSDVLEKIRWARDNQKECERIASRATEFINRLVMSEQAQKDNEEILKRMRVMYQQRYGGTFYEYCTNVLDQVEQK